MTSRIVWCHTSQNILPGAEQPSGLTSVWRHRVNLKNAIPISKWRHLFLHKFVSILFCLLTYICTDDIYGRATHLFWFLTSSTKACVSSNTPPKLWRHNNINLMLCNFGFSCLPLRRRTFFIALLLTFVAVAIKVRVVFRFLKHHPMPIHFITSQIHDADHKNHTYFALECHLEDQTQCGTESERPPVTP